MIGLTHRWRYWCSDWMERLISVGCGAFMSESISSRDDFVFWDQVNLIL